MVWCCTKRIASQHYLCCHGVGRRRNGE
jgi:hypothetical protein